MVDVGELVVALERAARDFHMAASWRPPYHGHTPAVVVEECGSEDCKRNVRVLATVRTALPAILDRLEALEKVAEAARPLLKAPEGRNRDQRFMAKVDQVENLRRALAQLDKET